MKSSFFRDEVGPAETFEVPEVIAPKNKVDEHLLEFVGNCAFWVFGTGFLVLLSMMAWQIFQNGVILAPK